MDKQLWQDVENLFHDALQIRDSERMAFVQSRAVDNSQLQFEVLTLLKSHDSECGFLEGNATPDWSDSLEKLAGDLQGRSQRSPDSTQNSSQPLKSSRTTGNAGQLTNSDRTESFSNEFDSSVARMIETMRPDFVVKKVISRGGMGTVLRVYQRKLNRDVAVKVLSATEIDETMSRRFVRESKAAAQVKNDYVVRIHEVCNDSKLPFLVMELVEGPSLQRYIEMNKGLDPDSAAELARQIAVGLAAAHQQHLIHRDIKPANVLLEPSTPDLNGNGHLNIGYRAKIIDFGLARDIDNPTGETQDQLFAGTLHYMSPEQLTQPDSVDRRSDIYSLGITLYQMLTGERPFRGAPHMVMRMVEIADPTPPGKFDDRIPKDLESICLKAIAKDPNRRYQSATEFADDLTRFLKGEPTEARPVPRLEKFSRWVGRNQKVALLAGLAAGLLIVLTISSLIFAYTVDTKDRRISAQVQAITSKDRTISAERVKTTDSQVNRVLDADAGALRYAIEELELNSETVVTQLESEFARPANDFNRRFNAAVALSMLGSKKTRFIIENLDQLFVSPAVFSNVIAGIQNDSESLQLLRDSIEPLHAFQQDNIAKLAKRILLLAQLGELGPWTDAINHRIDLSVNTEVIHLLPNWHGDLVELSKAITASPNPELQWSFCHAVQLLDRRSLNQEAFESLSADFQNLASQSTQFANYIGAKQLLKKWGASSVQRQTGPNRAWYELNNGIRMVKVQPMTSKMGRLELIKKYHGFPPHDVTITRPFYFSDTEVTVAQFLEFVQDSNCPDDHKPLDIKTWDYSGIISPGLEHPIQMVSWYDAVMFCNWLSRREGLKPFYRRLPESIEPNEVERENVIYLLDDGQSVECEHWAMDPDANGYRLPHEHEFGLACRAGSESKYFYGWQTDYFDDYGLASNHTRLPASPVRSRLANQLGIFDLHGNVWEWCNDWFYHMDQAPQTDPVGPEEPETDPLRFGRSIRSGGVGTRSGETDSDARGAQRPDQRHDNLGFRVARYADRKN